MTKFNPENKKEPTYGDLLDPAMKITDPDDAAQYFQSYVEHLVLFVEQKHPGETFDFIYDESVNIAKSNLGYFAGYCDNKTRERVERLFCCEHPIFGSIQNGTPTAEQAFKMGEALGRKMAFKKLREAKIKKINNSTK